jgi:DNA-binding NarL/FixJ family response regulator
MIRLTAREQEVLALLIEKGKTRPVAEALGRSVYTVRAQKRNIMNKLGERTTAGLVGQTGPVGKNSTLSTSKG